MYTAPLAGDGGYHDVGRGSPQFTTEWGLRVRKIKRRCPTGEELNALKQADDMLD